MPCPVRADGARLDGRPAAAHRPDQLRECRYGRRDPLPRRGAGRERGAHRRADPARHLPDPGARAGAAGRRGARGDPREPGPRYRADRAGCASHAGGEAALDRSGARREGVPDPAPAGSGHADRAARLHPRRGRRHAPQAGGEQDGPARGGAALQLRADHGPRREHRALPRSAAAARHQNRWRSRAPHLRVSAQARQRRRACHHPGQVFGATVAAAPTRQRVQALEGRSLSSELTGFRRREIESLQERAQMAPPSVAALGAIPGRAAAESAQAPGQGLVGRTTIVPDQATNSLVIRTAPPNFSVLQETIEQLDVRPPQVLLEVLIAEVTLDRASQFGINWQLLTQRGVSGDSTRGIGIGVGPQSFGDTLLQGFQGLGVRVVSLASLNVRAILQALASRTNVRVLSTPRVLALNNEEARILVGSEVPFVSSTFSGLTAGLNTVVQFRNVGTQLTVVPTVNNDGYVTFRVLQEVSALSATTIAAAQNAPVITTREAETSAIVKNGHTIVIGGLIGETTQEIESGVPILKDVPILGYLFKSRSTSRQRTELAIFLTPYVVYTDEQADSLLQRERERLPNMKQGIDSMMPPPPRKP